MPDSIQTSSGHGAAHAGGSYLSAVAFPVWISLFGPRPNLQNGTTSDIRPACAGVGYLSAVVFPAWISLFSPRPDFHLSTTREEKKWLEWADEGRHHGLAAFHVDADGLVSKEPIKTIPRKRPGHVSSRQWGRC
jgi:hypothetical protein